MLYIVSTPIGNMEDITFRAVRILKEVDLIAAEDTRKTRKILSSYSVSTEMTSYHSYNLGRKTDFLIDKLNSGANIALVSDSGTPGISDPGSVLIKEAVTRGLEVTHVPGPTAFVTALLLSGMPTHGFVFEGFLSNKSSRRKKALKSLKDEKRTVVLYESPHRILAFLKDFQEVAGDREIIVARELTKKFEEVRRQPVSRQIEHFSQNKPKGEFVIVF